MIELLVVMAIIAVLGALLLPRIAANAKAAKTGACKQNMLVAATGVEMYKIEHNNNWPDNINAIKHYVGENAIQCPDGEQYQIIDLEVGQTTHKALYCDTHDLAYDLESRVFVDHEE